MTMTPVIARDVTRRALRLPLWLMLGLTFGGIAGVTLAVFGWTQMRSELDTQRTRIADRALRVVTEAATTIDGDLIETFRSSADEQRPEFRALQDRLQLVRETAGGLWIGLYRRTGDSDVFLMDSSQTGFPLGYPLFERWTAYDIAFAGQPIFAEDLEDAYGRWDSALAPVRAKDGRVTAILGLDQDSNWSDALVDEAVHDLVLQLVVVTLSVMLVAALVSRFVGRRLLRLEKAARAVAAGDLTTQVATRGADEIGQLGRAFNAMVKGLREREVMRDAFGRYVTPDMAKKVLSDPRALRPGGELRTVTILMSDLRGFTGLAERFSAAEMVELLNAYLGRMADCVARQRGTVIEFIGDAVMALFGAPDAGPDDAERALRCAAEMQLELERFNAEHASRGLPPLEMGIGVHTGNVIVGNIGSERRLKYGVVGDDVNLAGRIESFTVGGEVLLSRATSEAVPSAIVRGPIPVKAKGKSEPLDLFALVGIDALQVPAEHRQESLLPAQVDAIIEPLEGKAVGGRTFAGRVTAMSATSADLVPSEPLPIFANVKLTLTRGDVSIANVYAKVTRAGVTCRIRFTSLPSPDALAPMVSS